jgi:hypothetical protein
VSPKQYETKSFLNKGQGLSFLGLVPRVVVAKYEDDMHQELNK